MRSISGREEIAPMQVTETAAAGLKREYRVVVPATDLEARVNERLDDLKGRVQLRGFRPGKVPVSHLKRLYGKATMAEVIDAAVREANNKIVTDHGFKLATAPKVVLPADEGGVEGVIAGKSDLAYTVEIEIVPPIALTDFQVPQSRAAHCRSHRRRNRSGAAGDCRAEPAVHGQGRSGGKGRPGHDFLPGHGRRQAVRRRLRRGRASPARVRAIPPRLRGPAPRHQGRGRSDVRHQGPRELANDRGRRQGSDICGYGQGGRDAGRGHAERRLRQDARIGTRWPSCGTPCASASSASMPRRRARSSSARCSISSTSATNSSRRPAWLSRSSTMSGRRSRATSSSRAALLRMKEPPRRRRAPSTAPSPSGGCGWGW